MNEAAVRLKRATEVDASFVAAFLLPHLIGRGQRHSLKGKLGLVLVDHVFDHEVLFAVRTKGCQGVAKR